MLPMFRAFLSRRPSAVILALAALLASCGGSSSSTSSNQVEPFKPNRIISFGDETSAILTDGRHFGVNGLNPETRQFDCTLNPTWNQQLASSFGMIYAQCNPYGLAVPQGKLFAEAGYRVADVSDKLDQFLADDHLGPKDLVTFLVGMNDVIEIYRQFPAQNRESLIAEAKARGTRLADLINRIANANGRVIVSTIYDMGLTPFALMEKENRTDVDRAVLLDDLSQAFNTALRVRLLNDGRYIGLVLADETVQQMARFPYAFGLANVSQGACRSNVSAQSCSSDTLLADAAISTWLWATDTLLTPSVQSRIGQIAIQRAHNNPF